MTIVYVDFSARRVRAVCQDNADCVDAVGTWKGAAAAGDKTLAGDLFRMAEHLSRYASISDYPICLDALAAELGHMAGLIGHAAES